MKLGIAANPRKPEAMRIAEHVVRTVGDRAEVAVSDETPSLAPERPHEAIDRWAPDLQIAIGGDGTFLYTLGRCEAPLLPINAGTVGVLAEIDGRSTGRVDEALERVLAGRYFLERRMKLAAELDGKLLPDVANEYVIHSTPVGKMGLFEIAVDGRGVGQIRADGVIAATPTGSTAYSLSSLGPIVDPALDALVLTTIAPFRLEPRSVVIEPLHTLTLRSIEEGREALVIADGQREFALPRSAAVTVYRSPRRAVLVRFGSRFFERLTGKRILPWSDAPIDEDDRADLPAAP
ncbi:MAG TPA: NAD(+)/NADH kinase [Thermoplasmata archaeon]|nr:NAD(+)/NADH kinase [Thermoplasmata archaeon]